jgi:hypothetical protein
MVSETNKLTSAVASLTSTPKVNVHKITFLLKLEDTVECFQYVRMKFRAHFISLTENKPGIKNYTKKRTCLGKRGHLVTLEMPLH